MSEFYDEPEQPTPLGGAPVDPNSIPSVLDYPSVDNGGIAVEIHDNRHIDLIVHQGKLHIAWVGTDASSLLVEGPFVRYWDGAAWVALGGDIGVTVDGLTPVLDTDFSVQPIGTRYYPNWATLASDGTTLYLLYTYREAAAAPGGGTWGPRHEVVKKWDGVSWTDFGKIDPSTNNSKDSGSGAGYVYEPVLCASAAEPGVCYASFREQGFIAANPDPTKTWIKQTILARFDGSSLAGTQHTIATATGVGGVTFSSDGVEALYGIALGNEGGFGVYFRSTDAAFAGLQMFRFSDDALLQPNALGYVAPGFQNFRFGHAVRDGVGRYYIMQRFTGGGSIAFIAQIKDDGTEGFNFYLNNFLASNMPTSPVAVEPQQVIMPDGATNLWVIVGRGIPPTTEVWWFHQPCFGWSIVPVPFCNVNWHPQFGGAGAAVLLGDSIYFAHETDFNVGPEDYARLYVEEFPILRNGGFCGGGIHLAHPFGTAEEPTAAAPVGGDRIYVKIPSS